METESGGLGLNGGELYVFTVLPYSEWVIVQKSGNTQKDIKMDWGHPTFVE